jgi:hypothetical protein
MGDLHHALEAGVVTRANVYTELGEVVAGKKPGRESQEEITSSTAREWHSKTLLLRLSYTKRPSETGSVFV